MVEEVKAGREERLEGEPAEAAPAEAADPCVELRRQLEEAQAKADSYLDQLRRTAAEFSNYKKRTERENSEFQKYATAGFIKKLLPVLDDLDRAFRNLPEHLREESWINGVELVRQKLTTMLGQDGNRNHVPLFRDAKSVKAR